MAKKVKKLGKEIVGTVVKIAEVVTGKLMEFDFSKYPKEIQEKLGPFGLNHKLGDAAAGKSGQEAVDAIMKVHEGLMKGDWSVHVAPGERIAISTVNANIEKLPPAQQAAARELLIKLGVIKVDAKADAKPAAK